MLARRDSTNTYIAEESDSWMRPDRRLDRDLATVNLNCKVLGSPQHAECCIAAAMANALKSNCSKAVVYAHFHSPAVPVLETRADPLVHGRAEAQPVGMIIAQDLTVCMLG